MDEKSSGLSLFDIQHNGDGVSELVYLIAKDLALQLSRDKKTADELPLICFKAAMDKRILCATEDLSALLTIDFFGDMHFPPQCPPYTTVRAVQEGGRNAAWFVEHALFSGVVRQYRRGGIIGKFIHSHYAWQGEEQTRSWQEFKILHYLHAKGVPVAKPVAAMYQRHWLGYQAALITERVPHAITLVQAVQRIDSQDTGALDGLAKAVAQTILSMHKNFVNHVDLNAFNILVNTESQQVFLIDFDKARLEKDRGTWCQDNLSRLERHFIKVLGVQGEDFAQRIKRCYLSD